MRSSFGALVSAAAIRLSSKLRLGLAALIVGVSAFTVLPASAAATDSLVLVGTGTIFPGLSTSGRSQDIWFDGVGSVVLPPSLELVGCSWSGNDTIGTLTAGNGLFDGSCTTNCTNNGGVSGIHGGYNRTVVGVGIGGAFTSGCLLGTTFTGNCVFVPTDGPTVTSYAQVCHLKLVEPE